MKKWYLLFLLSMMTASCNTTKITEISSFSEETNIQQLNVYLDYSEVSTSDFHIKVDSVSAYGTSNCSFSLRILIKNLSTKTQNLSFENPTLIRESTGVSYSVTSNPTKMTLDSEIEKSVIFSSTTPTNLSEKYYFSVDFQDIKYKVFLYETPDELREDLTVTYSINKSIVHEETVKKGRTITKTYTYEESSHQYYASSWKDSTGKIYTVGTKIENNLNLEGTLSPSLKISTTSSDPYSFINGINHVHSDGVVAILPTYQNKEVCLGNYAIYNNGKVKEVYLPKTLHHIYNSNFSNCASLKTIYFAGTKDQWEAIPKDFVSIPSSVSVVYNTSFVY